MNARASLLDVENLHVVYRSHGRDAHVLSGVSLSIAPGETLGLVGESGSGKTTIGKTILGQVVATSGRIVFDGEDITHASRSRRRELGRDIQVVFQDPYGSLNPARTIGQTLAEPLSIDRSLEARANSRAYFVTFSRRSACPSIPRPAIRASSPAASGSASRSPAP